MLLPQRGGGRDFSPNLQQSRSPLIVTLAVASGFRVWEKEGRKEQGTLHIKPTKEDCNVPAEILLLHPKGLTLNPLYVKLNFASPKGPVISFFQRIFPWYLLLSIMGKSMDLFILFYFCRCFTLGNGWGVGHSCPPPQVRHGSLFQDALLLSGYLLASGLPMAFNQLQYVFSWKNRNKELLPNSSPDNYVLIFKGVTIA